MIMNESSADVFRGNDSSVMSTDVPLTPGDGNDGGIPLARILTLAYYAVDIGLNAPISFFGIIGNIITMIVFAKIGFKETANITLTAIAFWDLFKSMFGFAGSFNVLKEFTTPLTFFSYTILQGVVFTQMVDVTTSVSAMLAAYVAIERCMCVTLPFTVKFLLTRTKVIITCVAISIINGGLMMMKRLGYIIEVRKYGTYRYLMFTSPTRWIDHQRSLNYILSLLFFIQPYALFTIMAVCTIIIVVQLKRSSRLRSKNKMSGSKMPSSRENKTIKMLLVMISVYMIYFVMTFIVYRIDFKDFLELTMFVFKLYTTASMLNSSTNIFIFYFMSKEFNKTLRKLFHMPAKTS